MSGYILCQTEKAAVPYYIESISTNIYTLEELCYYLYHNLYLVDDTILNEGLCVWIEKELKLPSLAAKLRPHLGKFADMEDVLYPVFKEINYLTYEELRTLNSRLMRINQEHLAVRKKRKGDALVKNGMYVNAIRTYQELLENEDSEEVREGFLESVYHNLGCAYSYLFQMEKALECFQKAYEGGRSKKALKTYLLAYRSIRTPLAYETRLKDLDVEEEVRREISEELERFAKKPERQADLQQMDVLLEEFMRDYHRSTGS